MEVAGLLDAAADDPVARLALADWLEERGEAERARVVRLQLELEARPRSRRLNREAERYLRRHGRRALGGLWRAYQCAKTVVALELGLLVFLVSDVAPVAGPLAAGTEWYEEGEQFGLPYRLGVRLTGRDRNRVRGEWGVDPYLPIPWRNQQQWLEGAAVGPHVALVGPSLIRFLGPTRFCLRLRGGELVGKWGTMSRKGGQAISLRRAGH